jgi:hypothetical protein
MEEAYDTLVRFVSGKEHRLSKTKAQRHLNQKVITPIYILFIQIF